MLKEQFRRLGKHSTVYGLSSVLGASATLMLLPLLTRYLSPTQYGMLEVLTVFSAQLGILFQLGLGSALFKYTMREPQGQGDRGSTISTAFWTITGFTLAATFALLPFGPRLAQLLLGAPEHAGIVRWMLVKVVFDTIGVVPMIRLRLRQESLIYGGLSAARVFILLAFVLASLTWFDGGLTGVVIATAAESVVSALLAAATAARDLLRRIVPALLRPLLAFGLPLIPYAFAMTVLAMGDRYLLRLFGDLDEVGQYAVGYKIAATLSIPVRAFQVAWPSVMFSIAKAETAGTFYSMVLTYLLLLLGFCAVVVSVFARELILLLSTPPFAPAYVVVPFLVVAQVSLGVFYATAVGTNLTGKTYLQAVSAGLALVVFAVAGILLVPELGMIGAASATALGYLTLAVSDCIFSIRLFPVQYEWRRILLLVLVASALIMVGTQTNTGTIAADAAIKLGLVAAYPAVLYALGFLSARERAAVRVLLDRAARPSAAAAPSDPRSGETAEEAVRSTL